jgi:ABC-2 type transport system permease protein
VSQFLGVVRHEFTMSIRRPGFWIAYTLLSLFYVISILTPSMDGSDDVIHPDRIWQEAGHIVFMFNIFLPLLAGILSADRMQRDFRLGVRELQQSTCLSTPAYILSKYVGVLLSVLAPMLLLVVGTGLALLAKGLAPVAILGPLLLAFFAIAVPSHAFVVAFALAVPLVISVRIFQILFTGYWFWGNLLSSQAFPTISDTLLNAVGQYPLQGFFGMYLDSTHKVTAGFSTLEAILNLLVLIACVFIALFVLDKYLRWRQYQT